MKKRSGRFLVMAAVLGGALLFWRTGLFGVLPTDRTVVWRFPVSYGEVRKLELQVWEDAELLKREEQLFAAGIVGEPSFKMPLSKKPHQTITLVWLMNAAAPVGFQQDFDPRSDETVVIDMKKP